MGGTPKYENRDRSSVAVRTDYSFGTGQIVVIIDDDASSRRSTVRSVAAAGYEVDAFSSAEEFLRSPLLEVTSCLICDLRLPGLNGLQLQQLLQSANPLLPMIF